MQTVKPINLAATTQPGKVVLTVSEVADRLRVTSRHVADLIESGDLVAFDVSGRRQNVPVPVEAINHLAVKLNTPPSALLQFLSSFKKTTGQPSRCVWRIPVVEGVNAFVARRNSLNLGMN